jgi:TRAP-type C4-dicarboxylate transport system substrate-binding protein
MRITLSFCAICLFAAAASAAPTTWNLATGYRAESFHTENLAQFAREVDAKIKGGLTIQLHPNNSLVKLGDMLVAVESGRVQAGESILSGISKELPIAGVDSIPFVVDNYADAQRLWRLQRPVLERQLAARGLVLLYAVPWPPQGLYSSRPIRGAADFKGTRMRTYNAATVRIAEMLGASPVDVPMPQVGAAFAQRRIDNMITSAVTGVENQVWNHLHYYYELNAWFPKNMVYVNAGAWQQLRLDQRAAVQSAAQAAEARGWSRSEELAREATARLRAQGMVVDRVPEDFERHLKRLGERFTREWIHQVGHQANDVFIPYFTEPRLTARAP